MHSRCLEWFSRWLSRLVTANPRFRLICPKGTAGEASAAQNPILGDLKRDKASRACASWLRIDNGIRQCGLRR